MSVLFKLPKYIDANYITYSRHDTFFYIPGTPLSWPRHQPIFGKFSALASPQIFSAEVNLKKSYPSKKSKMLETKISYGPKGREALPHVPFMLRSTQQ
jgi:hypothetical protein